MKVKKIVLYPDDLIRSEVPVLNLIHTLFDIPTGAFIGSRKQMLDDTIHILVEHDSYDDVSEESIPLLVKRSYSYIPPQLEGMDAAEW